MVISKRISCHQFFAAILLQLFCVVMNLGDASRAGVVASNTPNTYARNIDVLYSHDPHVLASLSSQLFEYKSGSVKPVFEYFLDQAASSYDGAPIPDDDFFAAHHPVLSWAWNAIAERSPGADGHPAWWGADPESFTSGLDSGLAEGAPLFSFYTKADGRLSMTAIDWLGDNALSRSFVLNAEEGGAIAPGRDFDSYFTRYPSEVGMMPDGVLSFIAERLDSFWNVTWTLAAVGLLGVVVTRWMILAGYKRSRIKKHRHGRRKRSSNHSQRSGRDGGDLQPGARTAESGFPGRGRRRRGDASRASAPSSRGAEPSVAVPGPAVVGNPGISEGNAGAAAASSDLPGGEGKSPFPRIVRRPYHAIRCRFPG